MMKKWMTHLVSCLHLLKIHLNNIVSRCFTVGGLSLHFRLNLSPTAVLYMSCIQTFMYSYPNCHLKIDLQDKTTRNIIYTEGVS